MANPWDPLPLPLTADTSQSILFEVLGRTLDRWEYTEIGLSIMYCLFVGDPTFEKMREYGEGRIFRERQAILRRAADKWFTKHPNQNEEGEFDKLMEAATGFAARRNEIAHGVVMNVQGVHFWQEKLRLASPNAPHFLIVPSIHTIRKHDSTGMPVYGYASQQVEYLYNQIAKLEVAVDSFKRRLWPNNWPTVR